MTPHFDVVGSAAESSAWRMRDGARRLLRGFAGTLSPPKGRRRNWHDLAIGQPAAHPPWRYDRVNCGWS